MHPGFSDVFFYTTIKRGVINYNSFTS